MENKLKFIKRHTIYVMAVTLIVFFQGCHFTTGYINKEEDQVDGKSFLNRFYNSIKTYNYSDIDKLTSDTLRKVMGGDSLSKMCSRISHKIGSFKTYTITEFFIKREEGKSLVVTYSYKLKVVYEKGATDEFLRLRKQDQLPIKLISYKVYSDLLTH